MTTTKLNFGLYRHKTGAARIARAMGRILRSSIKSSETADEAENGFWLNFETFCRDADIKASEFGCYDSEPIWAVRNAIAQHPKFSH